MRQMSKPIGSAKVTTKGQITLPKEVRETLNIEVGDLLLFIEKNGDIVLRTRVE